MCIYHRCELRECRPLVAPANGKMDCRKHANAFPIPPEDKSLTTLDNNGTYNMVKIFPMLLLIATLISYPLCY